MTSLCSRRNDKMILLGWNKIYLNIVAAVVIYERCFLIKHCIEYLLSLKTMNFFRTVKWWREWIQWLYTILSMSEFRRQRNNIFWIFDFFQILLWDPQHPETNDYLIIRNIFLSTSSVFIGCLNFKVQGNSYWFVLAPLVYSPVVCVVLNKSSFPPSHLFLKYFLANSIISFIIIWLTVLLCLYAVIIVSCFFFY